MAFYQVDLAGSDPFEALALAQSFFEGELDISFNEEDLAFAERLLAGTLDNLDTIDGILSRYSKDWKLERMAAVDRSILRLGVYELLKGDLPPAVVIDQAVDMAKKYGDERSGAFVNAILDRVREEECGESNWT